MRKGTEPYFIGTDFGTGGVRTAVIDSMGVVLAQGEQNYITSYPCNGWAEQNPLSWWDAFLNTLSQCLQGMEPDEKAKIKAMSACATSSTLVPVDRAGIPLSMAMLWMDARSADEAIAINNTHHEILQYCGGEVSSEWIIPKIMWIKKNNKKLYVRTYKMVEQLDWINFMLSGKWVTSKCNATCKWNYLDIKGGWQDGYYKAIGFEDYEDKLVLDVKSVGEPIGTILPDLAEKFGLSRDVTLVQGGIDAHIAVLGLGVATGNKIGTIMGTSFVHLAFAKEASFQKGIWGPYHNAVLPDHWLLEGGQISAGGIVKWFNKVFNVQAENPFDLMSQEAEKVAIGAEGIVALDFFQGNRTPYKNLKAKGAFYGLSLKHTRAEIFRAILESVAFGTKNIIDNFNSQGCGIDSMVVCGGITKDEVWLKIIADAVGIPIIITENSQVGALGCCISSAVGMKVFPGFEEASAQMVRQKRTIEPDMGNNRLYKEVFAKYLDLYQSLEHLMV